MGINNPGIPNLLKNLAFSIVAISILAVMPVPHRMKNVDIQPTRYPEDQVDDFWNFDPWGKDEPEERKDDRPKYTLERYEAEESVEPRTLEELRAEPETSLEEVHQARRTLTADAFEELNDRTELSDEDYFREFVRVYKQLKLDGVRPESRKEVVVRYYKKERDKNRVYTLRNLGFYIHQRPTNEEFADLSSNAIYYGDQVHLEDVKMVAYTLMRQGLELKTIEPSQFHSDWKAHSIEIGADNLMLDASSLTMSDIRNLRL